MVEHKLDNITITFTKSCFVLTETNTRANVFHRTSIHGIHYGNYHIYVNGNNILVTKHASSIYNLILDWLKEEHHVESIFE